MQNTISSNNLTNRFLPEPESVLKGLEKEPLISDFTIKRELGSGTFGHVLLVEHNKTKIEYAIKLIDKKNKANINGKPFFRREIEIMYKIHHSNVVRLFGHFEDKDFCYFVMEYINNGNLYSMITSQKVLSHKKIASIVKNVISAVYYLHNMEPPIIHRDIKPENVLIGEKEEAKLTDFGWSNYIDDSCERNTFCGTPIYLAPEIIRGSGHDERVDIWCIGILLFELVTKKPPFSGSDTTLARNIINLKINWPHNISPVAKDLISQILKSDPNQRPSLKAILLHPFFTTYFPNATSVLVKPYQIHTEPYILSKDVPTIKYKVIKRTETLNAKQFKAIKRDNTPVPNIRICLDQITNLDTSHDTETNNNKILKRKLTSHLRKINSKDDKGGFEQLKQEYKSLHKKLDEVKTKIEEANSTKNEINKSISSLHDKLKIQNKKNKILYNKLINLFKEKKTNLSKSPVRLKYCNTVTSFSPDKNNLKTITKELAKIKDKYKLKITQLLSEQNKYKEQTSILENKESQSNNKIKNQAHKLKNLENDIEKLKFRELEIRNKIQKFK